jgi:hypothetical protein
MVTLGVNALARETGLPRQTVSDRMRKGATAAEIRLYAAMRERRSPGHTPATVASLLGSQKSREAATEFDATLKVSNTLEAIADARLRRAQALAEKQEIENQLVRSQLIPRVYLQEWITRLLGHCREVLVKGPLELRDVLAVEVDAAACAATLHTWVVETLSKFAQTDELWAVVRHGN